MRTRLGHRPYSGNHRRPENRRPFVWPRQKGGAGARIECWGEADAALAELGRVRERLAEVERERQQALVRAEQAAARAVESLEARRQGLERGLERFCRRSAPELERVNGHSRRSRRLLFGRVGFRASQAVVVRSEGSALQALAHWRTGQQFLRVRTELDREALRQFLLRTEGEVGRAWAARRRLRRAGVRLDLRQHWFYELDERALARWS